MLNWNVTVHYSLHEVESYQDSSELNDGCLSSPHSFKVHQVEAIINHPLLS